jgi:uncharacterized membrane protein
MKKILLLGIVALSVSSCYYDNSEDLYPVDPNACETTELTYDANVKAIFSQNCSVSGCHVAGAQTPALETYTEVKDNLTRIEFRALIEKTMPPSGPLTSCEQSQLTQWIADGAPEN